MKWRSLASVCVLMLAAVFVSGQSTVRDIDRYVRTVERTVRSGKPVIFADTKDYEESRSKWKRFASEASLEKFREKTETYSIAYCWKKGGRFVAVNFTDFSPSGDWAQYTFHFFRPNGTLARVDSEMRTFMGDYIIRRSWYFNAAGRRIGRTTRYLDLTTKKPKAPTDDMKDANNGYLKFDHFMSVSKLPFAKAAGIRSAGTR